MALARIRVDTLVGAGGCYFWSEFIIIVVAAAVAPPPLKPRLAAATTTVLYIVDTVDRVSVLWAWLLLGTTQILLLGLEGVSFGQNSS